MADPKSLRCAIYTRKSTEDGLEQEFNSLDAQRVACAAYIESQRHEGWSLVAEHYDDGGFSGGSMKRPSLSHLLADLKAGRVDVIVVYKVDRLTRSLPDFARIVEILDDNDASFVSVTQSFNTTSSMGRLTPNVLLSFAQFEREVTGERIRDKIAASKARGMWMGGNIPAGYDVQDRKLVINPEEAAKVRTIFERYVEIGSVAALARQLEASGVRSPQRISRNGRTIGGAVFSKGALYALLKNRIYVGEVSHCGKHYRGQHEGIIDSELFRRANALLASNRANTILGLNAEHPSLLKGLVWDSHGRRMRPDHAAKRGTRYRYYVSCKDLDARQKSLRLPAGDIEGIVLAQLRQRRMPDGICTIQLGNAVTRPREEILSEVEKVVVHPDALEITFSHPDILGNQTVKVDACLARRGNEMKFVDPASTTTITSRDPSLIKLVVKAYRARTALELTRDQSVAELAESQNVSSDYFRVVLRISYLAPDIVASILEGRQPVQLNRQRLARMTNLPASWQEQREALGFAL